MLAELSKLPARSADGAFRVVVESPKGATAKIKFDPELGAFKFSRPLVQGLFYPHDWGFIPSTLAPDGDPLDALVFSDFATYPGVIIECRPLGVLRLEQNRKKAAGRERNDRIIAIPMNLPRFDCFQKPDDLPLRWREEIETFFLSAIRFENKEAKLLGWGDPAEGEKLVDQCAQAARSS